MPRVPVATWWRRHAGSVSRAGCPVHGLGTAWLGGSAATLCCGVPGARPPRPSSASPCAAPGGGRGDRGHGGGGGPVGWSLLDPGPPCMQQQAWAPASGGFPGQSGGRDVLPSGCTPRGERGGAAQTRGCSHPTRVLGVPRRGPGSAGERPRVPVCRRCRGVWSAVHPHGRRGTEQPRLCPVLPRAPRCSGRQGGRLTRTHRHVSGQVGAPRPLPSPRSPL